MTLFDLLRLARHHWKMMVGIPLACAVAVALVAAFLIPAKYEASATVTASDPSGTVPTGSLVAVLNSFVQEEIEPYATDDSLAAVSVSIDASLSAQPITITVEGASEGECVDLANELAVSAAGGAEALFKALDEADKEQRADLKSLSSADEVAGVLSGSLLQEVIGTDRTFEFCSIMVTEATHGNKAGFDVVVLTLLGFAGGLFVALLVIVGIDLVKKPITSRGDVEELTDAPVLGNSFDDDGSRLWATIALTLDGPVESICLVPLSAVQSEPVARILAAAAESAGASALVGSAEVGFHEAAPVEGVAAIVACPPLSQGAAALWNAHAAQATVVVGRLWFDSLRELADSLRDLEMIGARVLGVVLVD